MPEQDQQVFRSPTENAYQAFKALFMAVVLAWIYTGASSEVGAIFAVVGICALLATAVRAAMAAIVVRGQEVLIRNWLSTRRLPRGAITAVGTKSPLLLGLDGGCVTTLHTLSGDAINAVGLRDEDKADQLAHMLGVARLPYRRLFQ